LLITDAQRQKKKEMGKCLNKRINEERKTEPYDKAFTFVFCVCVQVHGYIQNSDGFNSAI
jgi:hypothetical protein